MWEIWNRGIDGICWQGRDAEGRIIWAYSATEREPIHGLPDREMAYQIFQDNLAETAKMLD